MTKMPAEAYVLLGLITSDLASSQAEAPKC